MEKPDVCLWHKDYSERMSEWVVWHIEHTDIDNLPDFMRWFMKMSRGLINPQLVKEAWEIKCQDFCIQKKK